jgi:hypothetical protein
MNVTHLRTQFHPLSTCSSAREIKTRKKEMKERERETAKQREKEGGRERREAVTESRR